MGQERPQWHPETYTVTVQRIQRIVPKTSIATARTEPTDKDIDSTNWRKR